MYSKISAYIYTSIHYYCTNFHYISASGILVNREVIKYHRINSVVVIYLSVRSSKYMA